jgi:hypothetical protein
MLNKETCVIFLDVEGAFDAIPHYLLLHKIKAYGLSNSLINFLKSYLDRRRLRVKVNGSVSDWSAPGTINSGVPQGSILGPLLFLLYINDLSEVVHHCKFYLYADDCALLPVHINDDPAHSHELLNVDIDNICKWSKKWKLKVIFHSPSKDPRDHPIALINNDDIPRARSHKHLGLILDDVLSFQEHIDNVVLKCNKLLYPLKPLSHSLKPKHIEKLYMSFIFPHLEYGSLIFDGTNQYILSKLDNIHYRAALNVSVVLSTGLVAKRFRLA